MCGRYTLTDPGDELLRHFDLPRLYEGYTPRYNIAPSQPVTAIVDGGQGERRIGSLRWGLIPRWAKDATIAQHTINARAETVAERPSFRTALRRRRCLIPADGFYEWRVVDGRKQPVRFVAADGGLFAFAGLWESWRRSPDAAGEKPGPDSDTGADIIYTCTIITTTANDVVRPVHHRMPVIIPPEQYDLWLDRETVAPQAVLPLLRPYRDDALRAYAVSTAVNNARNEGPDLIAPLTGA